MGSWHCSKLLYKPIVKLPVMVYLSYLICYAIIIFSKPIQEHKYVCVCVFNDI